MPFPGRSLLERRVPEETSNQADLQLSRGCRCPREHKVTLQPAEWERIPTRYPRESRNASTGQSDVATNTDHPHTSIAQGLPPLRRISSRASGAGRAQQQTQGLHTRL